jgi:DNA-binding beta-propeller fold protein YncE
VSPNGQTSLFFQGTPPLGLTTALGVLKKGFVIVGNVPTTNGNNPQVGSLLVLDHTGKVVATFTDAALLDGPWDLAIQDNGNSALVFVSCVLNGTVTRLDLTLGSENVTLNKETQIASGYKFAPNAAALVVGPTGLAYDPHADLLYVASTADNEIFAVTRAATATSSSGTGKVIFQDNTHLHGPLGLVLAPNGNLISAQGDAINPDPAHQSEIVEFTKTGKFVTQFSIDSAVGAAFGIAIAPADPGAVDFAAVDDATNTLTVFEFSEQ